MPYRLLTIHVENEYLDRVHEVRDREEVIDSWKSVDGNKMACFWMIVPTEDAQVISDKLQPIVNKSKAHSLTTARLEYVLPKREAEKVEEKQEKKRNGLAHISREELYENVFRSSKLSATFAVLVVLSTVVASIGLLEDSVAVVIGAMVIAPLLGPNLALALSTALGDKPLAIQSLKANAVGISICLILSVLIGYFWPGNMESEELLARTEVKYDSIALAIASGAAAALSLTTGISSALVGVMVAVALLPPAATFGIMLGVGQVNQATGALLLLCVNIVSVNLAAKLVFWVQQIRPRHWYKQKQAISSMRLYIAFWIITLVFLAGMIYLRNDVEVALDAVRHVGGNR